MSCIVETNALRHHDLFELPTGSVYEVDRQGSVAQARVWCAHLPDAPTAEPPLIDLPALPTVRRLDPQDQGSHTRHAGYVRQVFVQEMDRRHNQRMHAVYENINREHAATQQRERAARPWWKKLFA